VLPPFSFMRDSTLSAIQGLRNRYVGDRQKENSLAEKATSQGYPRASACLGWPKGYRGNGKPGSSGKGKEITK